MFSVQVLWINLYIILNLSNNHFYLFIPQVAWAGSTHVGCGIAQVDYEAHPGDLWRDYYIVCQYTPAGNYLGEYVDNVRPLTGDAVVPTNADQLEMPSPTPVPTTNPMPSQTSMSTPIPEPTPANTLTSTPSPMPTASLIPTTTEAVATPSRSK